MTQRSPLGLESGTVRVVPYDLRWQEEFATAAYDLQQELGSCVLAVHHVGSTAVPGLCSKPVLDLLVAVSDLETSLRLVSPLQKLGYEFRPDEEIPDRHYFRRGRGTVRTHHLSLAQPTSAYYTVTLAFRDALRANPAEARSYGELKLELARRFPRNREAYTRGKSEFVGRVLAHATSDPDRQTR